MAAPSYLMPYGAIVEPLISPKPPKPKGGRPQLDDHTALTGILFVLSDGERYADLGKLFNQVVARCNFPRDADQLPYSPYSLRHTFATISIAEGRSYEWVAEVMGTSPRMLRDHYKQGTIEQSQRYLRDNGLLIQMPNGQFTAPKASLNDIKPLPDDHPAKGAKLTIKDSKLTLIQE